MGKSYERNGESIVAAYLWPSGNSRIRIHG